MQLANTTHIELDDGGRQAGREARKERGRMEDGREGVGRVGREGVTGGKVEEGNEGGSNVGMDGAKERLGGRKRA